MLAVSVAATLPLGAYAASPALVPGLAAAAVALVAILRRPELGIAVALTLAPLTNFTFGGDFKPFQLLLPALAFGLLVYGALVVDSKPLAYSRWLTVGVAVFACAAVIASIAAEDPGATVRKLVIVLTAAALYFAVLTICRDRRKLLTVVGGALAGLLLAAAQGVVQYYFGIFSGVGFLIDGSLVVRVQGSFGHPNQYAGYLAFLIPLAGSVAVRNRFSPGLRWLAAAGIALALPALVFSFTRGAILALVLGSLLWLALLRPRAALLVGVAIAVLSVAFAPATLKERFDPQKGKGDVPLRADIWEAAVDIYATRPVFGVGLNNFPNAYASLPTTLSTGSQRRLLEHEALIIPPHAQNLYLNVLAEQGIVGFAALALLAAAALLVLYRGAHVTDAAGRIVALATGAGVFAIGVHSVLEVTLLSELALPLFALLAVVAGFVALEYERRELEDAYLVTTTDARPASPAAS